VVVVVGCWSVIGKCQQFTKGELSYNLADTAEVSPSLEVIGARLKGCFGRFVAVDAPAAALTAALQPKWPPPHLELGLVTPPTIPHYTVTNRA
jgi:hypothetical protein